MKRKQLVAAALATAAGASSLAIPAAATTTVSVGDNYFVRSTGVPIVTVARGSRVSFRWVGRNSHNVHGIRVNLGTGCGTVRTSGSCLSPVLNTAGRYTVYCQIHGAADMRLTLRVT
jgi:plastocyanin